MSDTYSFKFRCFSGSPCIWLGQWNLVQAVSNEGRLGIDAISWYFSRESDVPILTAGRGEVVYMLMHLEGFSIFLFSGEKAA